MTNWSVVILLAIMCIVISAIMNMIRLEIGRDNALEASEPRLNKKSRIYLDNFISYAITSLGYRENIFKVSEWTANALHENFDNDSINMLIFETMSYLDNLLNNIEIEVHIINETKNYSEESTGQNKTNSYNKKFNLYLRSDYTYNEIVAIICRLCTHEYLSLYGIKVISESENELFTDIAAIYLGFGEYIKEGFKEERRIKSEYYGYRSHTIQTEGFKIGYLYPSQINYVIEKFEDYRKNVKETKDN